MSTMQSSRLWVISSHKMFCAFIEDPINGYLRVTEIVTRQLTGTARYYKNHATETRTVNPVILP